MPIDVGSGGARFTGQPPKAGPPRVSVIIPVRNEGGFIARTVECVLNQDYARDRIEVLIVDGDSTDETPEIVARMAADDPRLRLLRNPDRHVAQGLNVGIRASRGEIVIRVDGHCLVPSHYVSTCVRLLQEGVADCVGGPPRAMGIGWAGTAIAMAMRSPFGVGGATFRYTTRARYVDHVPFGAYWRHIFERIGLFDPELVRNQDDELSCRLIQAGGRIFVDPAITTDYWSRSSFRGLWYQYFGYGYYKVRVIRKRGGRPFTLRQLVPSAFLLGLLAAAVLSAALRRWEPIAIVSGGYAAFLVTGTLWMAIRWRRPEAILFSAAIGTMHVAYGIGFLIACIQSEPGTGSRGP